MSESKGKSKFMGCLRGLLRAWQICGFAHFTFNSYTGRFEDSIAQYFISWVILQMCCFLNGLETLMYSLIVVGHCLGISYFALFEAQKDIHETILWFGEWYWLCSSAFLVSRSFLSLRDIIVPTLNEMIKVFERIRAITEDASIYFPIGFHCQLFVKVCLMCAQVFNDLRVRSIPLILGNISVPFTIALIEIIFWSHLYSNLVLICFYTKMDKFIASTGIDSKAFAALVEISFRINRLKETLNQFFSVSQICTYLGAVSGVMHLYEMFVFLLSLKNRRQMTARNFVRLVLWKLMKSCMVSYDNYLMAYVADLLIAAETTFRRRMFLMFTARAGPKQAKQIDRDIELLLLHDPIRNVSTKTFKVFIVNQNFSLIFFKDIIFGYAIVCLQMYLTSALHDEK